MGSSLPAPVRSTQSHSVDSRLTANAGRRRPAVELGGPASSIEVHELTVRSSTLALIEEALIRAVGSQEAAASFAHVDKSQLSKGLRERDRKTFDPRWLDRQPVEFWIALHKLIGMKHGLTSDSPAELLLKDAIGILRSLESLLSRTVTA